ncbi:hypothetical protein AO741_05200 [Pseudomonas sp. TTU2014-105ASC]|nr:hypothetical protein AO741_05200 [Pseudomonas sp. TTU2014-105ASC]
MALYAQVGLVITPPTLLNALALVSVLCGSWLLLATQWREARAPRRALTTYTPKASHQVASNGTAANGTAANGTAANGTATRRINQVFYKCGVAGLVIGLTLSMASQLL